MKNYGISKTIFVLTQINTIDKNHVCYYQNESKNFMKIIISIEIIISHTMNQSNKHKYTLMFMFSFQLKYVISQIDLVKKRKKIITNPKIFT